MNPARVRQRLTVVYALSTLAVLLVALLAMREFARRALFAQHERATVRAMELVRSFFRAEYQEYQQVEFTVMHVAGELVFGGMTAEFVRPDGSTVLPLQHRAGSGPIPPVTERTVPLEADLAPGWGLRLRLSRADLMESLAEIDRVTLVALPLAVFVAALVAWWMTGRALAPVGEMAAAANQLTARVEGRLPMADPHDEFGRLGSAFNGLLDRLEVALAHERRFVADAAHELRTPVARMMGEAEARLASPPSTEDRGALERIHQELGRTSHLIDGLLHMARSDAGSPAERVPIFLDDVVADAVAPWEREMQRRNLTLDLTMLQEARVLGDRGLLLRMVGVLVGNAVRYTPDGGRITVAVTREPAASRLAIEDSGIGIPQGDRARIFQRFSRGETARSLAPEGSGLGLAIARSIATQHGATIHVGDSSLGGARFDVVFPDVPSPS